MSDILTFRIGDEIIFEIPVENEEDVANTTAKIQEGVEIELPVLINKTCLLLGV